MHAHTDAEFWQEDAWAAMNDMAERRVTGKIVLSTEAATSKL